MQRLKKHGLTIKNIQKTPEKQLAELIYPVSLYNNKAKHIKRTTDILAEKYNHDTPKTYEEVINLPGVGPKMGLLFMRLVTYI
jgi:endonuclease-3